MKNEVEETCQLRKMIQVLMMSVFLGNWVSSNTCNEERGRLDIPQHIHLASHDVPFVVHVDTVVLMVVVVMESKLVVWLCLTFDCVLCPVYTSPGCKYLRISAQYNSCAYLELWQCLYYRCGIY